MSETQRNQETMSANQSRRMMDPGSKPVNSSTGASRPKTDKTMPYQGGELPRDSIRLVEIEPAANGGDPVVCTLRAVTFGSKPKFEALSYRWATDEANDPITLNSFPFKVKKNLLDALLFFRRRAASGKTRQSLWIDALCINQGDMEERNRQVRIMDQIYLRANTVVVWLGSGYDKFQREMMGEPKPEADASQYNDSIQRNMVRELQNDEYWGRLWIIQEIGQAWKLRVCFGNKSFSWEDFIHLIAMHHGDGNTGPLRLDRLLRKEKYNDSHTLKRLLEEHREAKCLEPRDKVYGLVGLAVDAPEFPVDYNKSLYEVWKDTMVFMNRWGLFKDESQILLVGALVKSLLMANHGDPLSQISNEQEDQVDSTKLLDNPNNSLVFRLAAIPIGCILCVGPPASDLVSDPDVASRWRLAIQHVFSADEWGPARQESDELLRALLESNDSDVEMMCFNRPSTVVWKERRDSGSFEPPSAGHYIKKWDWPAVFEFSRTRQQVTDGAASVQPRIYLAKEFRNPTPRKMGVASGLVQAKDVVCWVRSSRRALLVRVVDDGRQYNASKARVFGTALTTEDVRGLGQDCDYAQRWASLKGKVEVQVDAGTIFMLLG